MSAWASLQNLIHETIVQPVLFAAGLMAYTEIAFDAIEWFVVGAAEIFCLAILLGWIERRYSFGRLVADGVSSSEQRQTKWLDVGYTLFHRLGVFPLLAFLLLTAPLDFVQAKLRLLGLPGVNLDQLWPGVTDLPLVSFVLYLVVLDFIDYWLHRAQHAIQWWWELHALHHSQRYMTFWSDQRNHVFDDLLRDFVMAAVALFLGVAPGQFIGLVVVSRVLQSIQHADWAMHGAIAKVGQFVLVGPRFHRVHHGIGIGHEGSHHGVNFGVLFSVWDVLFKTADFHMPIQATGVRDQLTGREYGRGFFAQQWLAILRILKRA
jgi:sterol desaturase/sphingolipid hydroxylase (fatty acid hydroxylase superfamily)